MFTKIHFSLFNLLTVCLVTGISQADSHDTFRLKDCSWMALSFRDKPDRLQPVSININSGIQITQVSRYLFISSSCLYVCGSEYLCGGCKSTESKHLQKEVKWTRYKYLIPHTHTHTQTHTHTLVHTHTK